LATQVARATGSDEQEVVVADARETAERHAQDVVDANFGRLMQDFAGDAMNEVMALGGPPQPTTKYEILSEVAEGDVVVFGVRYSNDTEALELTTRWKEYDGVWKVFKVEKARA
jgi:hypothetical protein